MYKRTNIEIDMDVVQEVMAEYKLKSIKEAVDFSLKRAAKAKKVKRLLDLKGKVEWVGDLDEMRKI